MSDCQNRRRHGDKGNVGKSCNNQKILSRVATAVVEIVDGDDAGSPGCNEEHNECKDHLESHNEGVR